MNARVIAIRPEPGCGATVADGAKVGLPVAGYPLFEVASLPWTAPPPDEFDALLIGSANAIRHGGPELDGLRGKPAFAVGAATAQAAREQGFEIAATGSGGLQALIDELAAPLRLLRLAGEDHVPLSPPAGVSISTRIVYASRALAMPQALVELLEEPAVVLLHSGIAASHFAAECDRCEVSRDHIVLAALAPRIAEMAGWGWRGVHVAARTTEGALLALAADLCHALRPGEGP